MITHRFTYEPSRINEKEEFNRKKDVSTVCNSGEHICNNNNNNNGSSSSNTRSTESGWLAAGGKPSIIQQPQSNNSELNDAMEKNITGILDIKECLSCLPQQMTSLPQVNGVYSAYESNIMSENNQCVVPVEQEITPPLDSTYAYQRQDQSIADSVQRQHSQVYNNHPTLAPTPNTLPSTTATDSGKTERTRQEELQRLKRGLAKIAIHNLIN